jgi:hypothetical protein
MSKNPSLAFARKPKFEVPGLKTGNPLNPDVTDAV